MNQIEEISINEEHQLNIQYDKHIILQSYQDKDQQFLDYDKLNSCLQFFNQYKLKWKKRENFRFQLTFLACFFSVILSFYLFAYHIDGQCPKHKFKSNDDCIELLIQVVPIWIFSIFISAGIIVSIIVLTLTKKIHFINGIVATIQAIYLIFYYHGALNLDRMSLRNADLVHSYLLLLIIFLDFLFILYIFVSLKIYQKSRQVFLVYILIQLVIIIKIWNIFDKSCDSWNQGLVHSLDTSDEYCEVKRPFVCWSDIFDNTFNMGPYTCNIPQKSIHDYKIETLKNYAILDKEDDISLENQEQILQDIKYIGWPLFNQMDVSLKSQEETVSQYIINNTKIYNTQEEAFQDGREVILDLHNLEMNIKIVRNETLVNERQKINVKDSLANNMIVIFIDTVSRRQLYRKLKKTMGFLRRYADFDGESYEKQGLGAKTFESFRFHSVDKRTQNNIFKFRFNMMYRDIKTEKVQLEQENKITSLFNDLKNAGYIFGHTGNGLSTKDILGQHYYKDKPLQDYFEDDPADHEMYLYDPNYIRYRNTFDVTKGGNSFYRRCIYGQDTNYYVLDYAKKFLDAYKKDKKFLLIELLDSHELTSEILQYLDDNLYKFLVILEQEGYFSKDTAFFMMSDHGQHLVSHVWVFKNFQSKAAQERDFYSVEKVLPFFLTTVTNDVMEKYKDKHMQETLEANEQRIFGMGEVRNTLLTTAYGYDYKYNYRKEMNQTNYNLYQELPTDRSCLDIGMNKLKNPFEFCSCKPDGDFNELYKLQQDKNNKQIEKWKKERVEQKQQKNQN